MPTAEQTKSPLPTRQSVRYAKAKLSGANTRKEQEEIQKVSIEKTFELPKELIEHEQLIKKTSLNVLGNEILEKSVLKMDLRVGVKIG